MVGSVKWWYNIIVCNLFYHQEASGKKHIKSVVEMKSFSTISQYNLMIPVPETLWSRTFKSQWKVWFIQTWGELLKEVQLFTGCRCQVFPIKHWWSACKWVKSAETETCSAAFSCTISSSWEPEPPSHTSSSTEGQCKGGRALVEVGGQWGRE